jgi:signal transduction histidine kinase
LLSISHDMRTPLTSIRGYAEAIVDGHGPPAEHAAIISASAARLDRLVVDLLDLARLQAKAFDLQLRPVQMSALAATTVQRLQPAAAAAGVALRCEASPVCVALADADRIDQVVGNLVQNALRFARFEVLVRVEAGDGMITVSIDDDGPGIAGADLPFVFERLYTARREPQRAENSSGLGLAIVRELVAAHGGEVGAGVSKVGGAALWFRVPVAR